MISTPLFYWYNNNWKRNCLEIILEYVCWVIRPKSMFMGEVSWLFFNRSNVTRSMNISYNLWVFYRHHPSQRDLLFSPSFTHSWKAFDGGTQIFYVAMYVLLSLDQVVQRFVLFFWLWRQVNDIRTVSCYYICTP